MLSEKEIKQASTDAANALLDAANATKVTTSVAEQSGFIAANAKLEAIIQTFHAELDSRSSGLRKSTEFISDPEMQKYIIGQADAYEWCVNELMRLVASA